MRARFEPRGESAPQRSAVVPQIQVGTTGFIGLSLATSSATSNGGFLEITRRSTIVGLVGYQTTPLAPVVIPIPEPTTITLLLGVGLVARRRSR